jgi:tight adherence protein B
MARADWLKFSPWVERAVLARLPVWARLEDGRFTAESVEALRLLSALMQSGLSPRAALSHWHVDAPCKLRPALRRAARMLELGASVEMAVASLHSVFRRDATALAAMFAVQRPLGGDLTRMLEGLADTIEQRESATQTAKASSAGGRLSAYLIAALPLVALLLAPAARAPLLDAVGVVMGLSGLGLGVVGFVWIRKLVPEAPVGDEPVAAVADAAATLLRGGAATRAVLEMLSLHSPPELQEGMHRARRLAKLGMPWTRALAQAGEPGLNSMAEILRRATEMGIPPAGALESFASARRAERHTAFEATTKRAPVLITVPLATCVLPSFVLLGVAPYVRGLTMG